MYTSVGPCIPFYTLVCPCIPVYTLVYLCIPFYAPVYPSTPLYTPVYPCLRLYTSGTPFYMHDDDTFLILALLMTPQPDSLKGAHKYCLNMAKKDQLCAISFTKKLINLEGCTENGCSGNLLWYHCVVITGR